MIFFFLCRRPSPFVSCSQQDPDEAVGGVRRSPGHRSGSSRHRRVRAPLPTWQAVRHPSVECQGDKCQVWKPPRVILFYVIVKWRYFDPFSVYFTTFTFSFVSFLTTLSDWKIAQMKTPQQAGSIYVKMCCSRHICQHWLTTGATIDSSQWIWTGQGFVLKHWQQSQAFIDKSFFDWFVH